MAFRNTWYWAVMQIGIREEKTNALASNFDEKKRRDMLGRTLASTWRLFL